MLSNYENRSSNTLKDPIKQKYRLSNVTRFCQIVWWVRMCTYSNRRSHSYCNLPLSGVKW